MEKKIVQVTQYKQVPSGKRDVVTFIASDGKEFDRKKDCLAHEEILEFEKKWSKIKKFTSYEDVNVEGTWYFAENDEEIEIIKHREGYYAWNNKNVKSSRTRVYGDIVPNKWFVVRIEDGGDRSDDVYFISLEVIKQEWEEFLKEFDK